MDESLPVIDRSIMDSDCYQLPVFGKQRADDDANRFDVHVWNGYVNYFAADENGEGSHDEQDMDVYCNTMVIQTRPGVIVNDGEGETFIPWSRIFKIEVYKEVVIELDESIDYDLIEFPEDDI